MFFIKNIKVTYITTDLQSSILKNLCIVLGS